MTAVSFAGIELIVLYYPGDHDRDIQSTIRKSLGNIEWLVASATPPVEAKAVSHRTSPRDLLILVDSLHQKTSEVLVLCHPSLKAFPVIWEALASRQRIDFDVRQRSVIRLCQNGAMFRKWLIDALREKRIDIESRLRRVLLDTHGTDTVDGWKTQFTKVGFKEYADFIISAMHLIERRHVSLALDLMQLNPRLTCVLRGDGSDYVIRRKLEGKPGWPTVPSLNEFLQLNRAGPISLVVDAVHGGGQVATCLGGLTEIIHQRETNIRILPLHATRRGISRLNRALDEMCLTASISIDISHSIVLENETPNSLGESVAVPELVLRMQRLGYAESLIAEVRSFSLKIGALLEQLSSDETFPDNTKGLGLHSLGLTTLIDGYPGLGVLPIIRTSCPQGTMLRFDSKSLDWRALVAHQNDQVLQN